MDPFWRDPKCFREKRLGNGVDYYSEYYEDYYDYENYETAFHSTSRPGVGCTCQRRPLSRYDDLHRLSQISHGFTRELGSCLWLNASLVVEDLEAFVAFAADRPAALPYIREVTVELNLFDDASHYPDETLAAVRAIVADAMDIHDFRVALVDPATEIAPEEFGRYDNQGYSRITARWRELFYPLKVRKTFDILWISRRTNERPLNEQPIPLFTYQDFGAVLRWLWMPRVLRPGAEATGSQQPRWMG